MKHINRKPRHRSLAVADSKIHSPTRSFGSCQPVAMVEHLEPVERPQVTPPPLAIPLAVSPTRHPPILRRIPRRPIHLPPTMSRAVHRPTTRSSRPHATKPRRTASRHAKPPARRIN